MGKISEDMRVISTDEELKVFNDPYRMRIIRTFQRSKEPLTVKGCADKMKEVPAKVHYHVKKLLSVKILELDHVEVINGINAKYYKLPKTSFTISLKDSDETNVYKHIAQVHSIISNVIDDFKESFMKASSKAVENEEKNEHEIGSFGSAEVYLTEEEFKEFATLLADLTKKYEKEGEGKKPFLYLGGLARKDD